MNFRHGSRHEDDDEDEEEEETRPTRFSKSIDSIQRKTSFDLRYGRSRFIGSSHLSHMTNLLRLEYLKYST